MPRLTGLDQVLFPVEEHPIYVSIGSDLFERQLKVPDKRALVHGKAQRVLGVVSNRCRLVTNQEALEMARECCKTVFPQTTASEWSVTAADAPATAAYCHMDLTHNSAALDFNFTPANEKPELFGPFIRVTNSYNGMRALRFSIGYYRKVCRNGLILPDVVIEFKFTHSRREIGERIQFSIAREKLSKLNGDFTQSMQGLRDFSLERLHFEPLILGALAIRAPKQAEPGSRAAEEWDALCLHVGTLSDRYTQELGENAYAAFNAITDLASHGQELPRVFRDRHGLQRLAGQWLSSFRHEIRKPEFTIEAYLTELNTTPLARSMEARDARSSGRN